MKWNSFVHYDRFVENKILFSTDKVMTYLFDFPHGPEVLFEKSSHFRNICSKAIVITRGRNPLVRRPASPDYNSANAGAFILEKDSIF